MDKAGMLLVGNKPENKDFRNLLNPRPYLVLGELLVKRFFAYKEFFRSAFGKQNAAKRRKKIKFQAYRQSEAPSEAGGSIYICYKGSI